MNITRAAAIVAILILPASADAGPRDDLIDGFAKCATIVENGARLVCYDALMPQLKTVQAQPASAPPEASADERAWYDPSRFFGINPSRQTRPEQFGSENLPPPPPPPVKPGEAPPPPAPEAIDSIAAGVTDYAFNPYGRFVVFLDNGQVWQQLQGDTGRAHFEKNSPNTVAISRGALGSYNLVVNDVGAGYKVRRVK